MIDIFGALGWLNALDNHSHLNNQARELSKEALKPGQSDKSVWQKIEKLRNAGQSPSDPLERAEILLHCAAIEYRRGWFPHAAYDANEAVVLYKNVDHCHGVALWILGIAQWAMLQNHKAHTSWVTARKIFEQREIFCHRFLEQRDWYQDAIWQMNVQLAARPEEIMTWLNYFEPSSLSLPVEQIVKRMREKIRKQAYPNIYILMQDLQHADGKCNKVWERAEVHLESGMALYQKGNVHSAIKSLRSAVQDFFPGIGTCHKQVVARCMLGALEWKTKSSQNQAFTDWTRSIQEFEKLRGWAEGERCQSKERWYAEHHGILKAALSERLFPRYRYLIHLVYDNVAEAQRLIELERKHFPHENLYELIGRAIERLLRDRR